MKSIYAKIKAEAFGAFPESLVNTAAFSGLQLWNVERIDENTVSFESYENCREELEKLAESCGIELKLVSCRAEGRRIMKSRYPLLVLGITAGLLLFVSSLFIWDIEIHGSSSLSKGALLRALEDSGVYLGRFWPGLKADEVRSRFLSIVPEAGWMTVNVSGSRAVVIVNERQPKPEIYLESEPKDLVASKTGILRRVSVLNGKAAVEAGQAVAEGELLAGGRLESIAGAQRLVCARGTVMADTWYEINAVCPEETDLKSKSGMARHRFALVFGKRRINFYIDSGKAIDECDKIIKDYTLGLEGHFALPVRIVHETLLPYESSRGKCCDSEQMGRSLLALLNGRTEGQLLQTSLTESSVRGLYVLTLRAHCVENIAVTQPVSG